MLIDRSARFVEERLRAGARDEWIVLRGWSMAPALRDGDRLRVQPLDGDGPRPGEIVVARRGARLVTHRLVRLDATRAVTRGDGCRSDDPPLARAELLGRVVEVERGARCFPPPPPGRLARLIARASPPPRPPVLALDEAAALARRGELPPRFELRAPGAAGRARFAPGPARRGALICLLDGDRLALRRALALRGGEALVRCDRAPFADGWRGDVVACALPPRGFDRLAELAPHAATRLGWRAKLALAALRSAAFRIRRAARRGPSPRFTTRAHAIDERTLEISLRDPRGAPAGSTRLERRGDEGYSFATEVAPPYRGLGGGRQLIEAALDVARGQGLARVTAHAAESNRASLAAYRAAGFRPTGRYWSSATQPLAAAERALVELERIC